MRRSTFNSTFPQGKLANFAGREHNYYTLDIYQGDVGDLQYYNSCNFNAGVWMPTGSVAYVDANNLAIRGGSHTEAGSIHPADTNSKLYVPCMVKVGNDHSSVKSEYGNGVGGLLTLVPVTGYFRFLTSVFEEASDLTYNIGDLLTVGEFQMKDGTWVWGVTKRGAKHVPGATSGNTVIVGVVDAPVTVADTTNNNTYNTVDVKGNHVLKFTAKYLPGSVA